MKDLTLIIVAIVSFIALLLYLYSIKKRGGIKKWIIGGTKDVAKYIPLWTIRIMLVAISAEISFAIYIEIGTLITKLLIKLNIIGGLINTLPYIFLFLIFIAIWVITLFIVFGLLKGLLVLLLKFVPLPRFLKNYISWLNSILYSRLKKK